jgi:outer membrane protein OmpA-like peptidoglycan-associated protein
MNRLKTSVAALALTAAALSLGACATEKYVNEHVAVVDQKAQSTQAQVDQQGQTLQQHDQRLGQLDQATKDAMQRADAANKAAQGKFTYTPVLTDDSIKFTNQSAKLTAEAQTRLMDLVNKLKTDNKNVYVEIQGHTDSREPMSIGQKRAEAVRQFMNQQGVALNRIQTIDYGKEQPVASNDTRAGRAQNRCVVLVVLS